VGPGLASRGWQPFQVKPPVEPMLAADRTAAPAKWRQAKRQEEIVPLKIFACGYRLCGRRTDSAASYPPLEGRAIAYDQFQPCVDTVVAWQISQRVVPANALRTQGPITPGLKREKRPLLQCRNENPRRRDERNCAHAGVPAFAGTTHLKRRAYENSICDGPGSTLRQRKLAPRIGACRLNRTPEAVPIVFARVGSRSA